MRKLNLNNLKEGIGGLTEAFGSFLAEAAMVCLETNHQKGKAILKVEGDFKENFEINWTGKLTEEVRNSWHDKKEATEYGATAIALLLLLELTDYDRFKRTRGGTDYMISKAQKGKSKFPEIRACLNFQELDY